MPGEHGIAQQYDSYCDHSHDDYVLIVRTGIEELATIARVLLITLNP